MKSQRMNEWEKIDDDVISYHMSQWDTPKRSTVAFSEFIAQTLTKANCVIDMGAGAGAATAYLANINKGIKFTAFDYSKDLIDIGKKIKLKRKIENLEFERGDWFEMTPTNKYDGCISLQTLSWLPNYETPLAEIFSKINPSYIALTSLFYEGDISCRIEVEEHQKKRKCFYNVYSLPEIDRFCLLNGYALKKYSPFEIDLDIEKPKNLNIMGTYTESIYDAETKEKKRLQISGPLLMNWYMVLIEKI